MTLPHKVYYYVKYTTNIQSTKFIKELRRLEDMIIRKHERFNFLHLFFTQKRHLFFDTLRE